MMIRKLLHPVVGYLYGHSTLFMLCYGWFRMKWYIHVRRHFYSKEFEPLKTFKGAYKGKRLFIVATGPSLTLEDVNKLKGELTFGMNSIVKLYDKTDWRPTFYGICDGSVYTRIKDDLNTKMTNEIAFYNHYGIKWDYKNAYPVPVRAGWCAKNDLAKLHIKEGKPYSQNASDITKYVYAGAHVVHYILQICFYMGFSEIYLLGTDCTRPDLHSGLAGYKDSNKIENDPVTIYNWMMADYESDKKFAEAHGIKIYNATRGGALELFERVDLDEVLK